MLLDGYVGEVHFIVGDISLVVAKVGKSGKAFPVKVGSQWAVGSAKNVQSKVEFFVSN